MSDAHHPRFGKLLDFLARIPAMDVNDTPSRGFGSGGDGGSWWVKFSLDIDHELAWETVQELGHTLNTPSLEQGTAAVFKPVSPPPYLNGGPEEFLSWVIEAPDSFAPGSVADVLEARLPQPVDDEAAWLGEREDDDSDEDDDEGDGDGGDD
jgi:hypothetical protein